MKFKVLQDLLLNVFLPLTLGAIIYLTGWSFIDSTFFKNHVADACWAYAFGSVLLILWDRNIPVYWLCLTFLISVVFEYLQAAAWLNGTGDFYDVITYFISIKLCILFNSFFKKQFTIKKYI